MQNHMRGLLGVSDKYENPYRSNFSVDCAGVFDESDTCFFSKHGELSTEIFIWSAIDGYRPFAHRRNISKSL